MTKARKCKACRTAPIPAHRRTLCDKCAETSNTTSKREWARRNAQKRNANKRAERERLRPLRHCLKCKEALPRSTHANRQYCDRCLAERVRENNAKQYQRRKAGAK